jgi:serine/threonine protein kinase
MLIAGADVNAVDSAGRSPCHIAAANAGQKCVELLIAAGARVNVVDNVGRTPCHEAAYQYKGEKIVEVLIAAGVDVEAVDADDSAALEFAGNSRVRELLQGAPKTDAATVAHSFGSVRTALVGARAARRRFHSLHDILLLVHESTRVDSWASAIEAICAFAPEIADAERAFATQQDILRAAEQLDERVVNARDTARQQLVRIAAAVLEVHNALPFGSLTALGNRVASAQAALGALQTDDGGDCGKVKFDDWFDDVGKSTAFKRKLTESGAEALAAAVQWLVMDAHDSNDRGVVAALARARLAAEHEMRALGELRVPRSASAPLVTQLDRWRSQIVQSLRLVDSAREVRAVVAPNCARLQAAQARVAAIGKEIKHVIVELEEPDDAQSEAAAKEQLRELKLDLIGMQRESAEAVIELAAHVYDFPELRLRFPKARLDDLFAADGDASALRTLGQYDNRVVIADTRNTVERASFGGAECALKLFRLVSTNQRAFVKEARRLRQLAHPNVVQVRAVFVDGQIGVIEMPFYTHGDIWKWLASAPRTVHEKLRVLRAALCGLQHVHRMGVVHADVKPENVFVGGDGVARLGDFDVSKEDATLVTTAGTVVGFSPSYAAPEILSGGGASKAGDMYAFGLTLFDIVRGDKSIAVRPVNIELLARHEPLEDGASLRSLARRLLDKVSCNRTSASAALKSTLFAPPAPGRDPAEHQRECTVCSVKCWLDEGVVCDQHHFVCNDDLTTLAQMFCSWPPGVIAKRGALRCAEDGCASAPWSNACLARSLSAEQFKLYIDRLREVAESRVLIEQRQLRDADLAQLERRLRGEMTHDEEVAAHQRVIRDELLCLQCPLCRTGFIVDFRSCLAMICAHCRTAFCGWCLKDCGEDAHHHVNYVCELNPTQPRNAFGNAAQFEEVHRQRRGKLVADYLQRVQNETIRSAVRAAIQRDLSDLRLWIV